MRSWWCSKGMHVGELLTQTYTECPAAYFGVVAFDVIVVEIMAAYSRKYGRFVGILLAGSVLGIIPGAVFGALVQGHDSFFASLPPVPAEVLNVAFIEASIMGASVVGAACGVMLGGIIAAVTTLLVKAVRATRFETPPPAPLRATKVL